MDPIREGLPADDTGPDDRSRSRTRTLLVLCDHDPEQLCEHRATAARLILARWEVSSPPPLPAALGARTLVPMTRPPRRAVPTATRTGYDQEPDQDPDGDQVPWRPWSLWDVFCLSVLSWTLFMLCLIILSRIPGGVLS